MPLEVQLTKTVHPIADRFSNKFSETVSFVNEMLQSLQAVTSETELTALMAALASEMGFRFWALIHHEDLRTSRGGLVNIKDYPAGAVQRIIGECRYRRDPIVRGCIFAPNAFIWSELDRIIRLDRRDRATLELGAKEGLNEGITVPYTILGECPGSCTFAGIRQPEKVERLIGLAQMVGVFAFQAARRLRGDYTSPIISPCLYPRSRDCVVLAGRGYSNKEIARALGISPRTVDGYLTEARRLFNAHDRTELVVSAVLAGEVKLHELKPRQSE